MFCPNCGKRMDEAARFCPECGKGIEAGNGTFQAAMPAAGIAETKVKKRKGRGWVIFLPILLIAAAIAAIVLYSGSAAAKKYDEHIRLAERYLKELEYDRAIAEYSAAIKTDENKAEAYLGLAEAYTGIGEYKKAGEVLNTGFKITGDPKLSSALAEIEAHNGDDPQESVKEEGIPVSDKEEGKESGEADEPEDKKEHEEDTPGAEEFEEFYRTQLVPKYGELNLEAEVEEPYVVIDASESEYGSYCRPPEISFSGLIDYRITDLDKDGILELMSFRLKGSTLIIEVYEKNPDIRKSADYSCDGFLTGVDEGDNILLKDSDKAVFVFLTRYADYNSSGASAFLNEIKGIEYNGQSITSKDLWYTLGSCYPPELGGLDELGYPEMKAYFERAGLKENLKLMQERLDDHWAVWGMEILPSLDGVDTVLGVHEEVVWDGDWDMNKQRLRVHFSPGEISYENPFSEMSGY